ncbi:MAG: single-stranded-DNA-specific exonuclease RecJ, partial [Bacteroidales bacterium]|nr:single-stranded-DNA-specific exonuclease RecJ [Bacteroidales bacterium]
MTEKLWTVKECDDKESVERLMKDVGVDKLVATLLVQRGIHNYDEAKRFFRPQLADLYDPFLMKDMDKAVDRLTRAIDNKEKILIFGDYDVDGTTATALMLRYLKSRNANVDFYIPDRYLEGYGLSSQGIDYAAENGTTLLITVDCGIKGNEKIDYANSKGIDVIVCDHHTVGEELPKAFAVLDPKRPDCNYPFNELSGCGVAFKLLQGYIQKHNLDIEDITRYLDLVAVSIGSDIVPIIDENRILAYYGLQELNTSPCTGLESIIDLTDLSSKEIQINDIVFKIGPRINAAGRIDTGKTAVELLTTTDRDFALQIGNSIDGMNSYRKEIDRNITEEAIAQIEADENLKNAYSTVVFSPNWHKGVVGIVASRLTESYYRPTIVLTENNGLVVGSARSVEGFDLYSAVTACGDLLESFGGHTYAAGLTMKKENLEPFRQRFEEYVRANITEDQRRPVIRIDTEIMIKEITPKTFRILKQFAPFGP